MDYESSNCRGSSHLNTLLHTWIGFGCSNVVAYWKMATHNNIPNNQKQNDAKDGLAWHGLAIHSLCKLKCQRTPNYLLNVYVYRKTCIKFRKYFIFLSVWAFTCSFFFLSLLIRFYCGKYWQNWGREYVYDFWYNETVHSIGVKAKNEPTATAPTTTTMTTTI